MIVGFNIESLNGERSDKAQGNLQVNYNPVIQSVESATVPSFDQDVARIDFTFTVQYLVDENAEVASIELEGNVLWNGDTEAIVNEWEENNQLADDIQAPLMNDLYRKCLSQAVGVSDTLNLLPPIPTPRVDQ
jgi:hypothetical protein